MLKAISYQKNTNLRHLRQLRSAIILLIMISAPYEMSCKKGEDASITEKEKNTGIHERYERGPAAVTIDVDQKEITIADRLNLKISVFVDEDYEIKLPGFGEKLEQFGIVDYHTTQPELLEGNRKKISRSYVLEPFLSGDYTIPPMEVKFWKKGEQGTGEHKIETSELTIKVKSLLPEDLKEARLHEISPPIKFPRSYLLWIWAGIVTAVIGIGIVAAIVILQKRKNARAEDIQAMIPAHELAYGELEKLAAEDLPQKGEIKLFYQRISGILRRYIENRFGLRAPEQTTEEFLAGLETARDFPSRYKALLKTFLSHCDLVKFAEYQPKTEDIQKTFDSCRAFIEGTEERFQVI